MRSIRYATERRRAEETLRASEELLRSAFENADVTMAFTDMASRFVWVNDAFSQMCGYCEAGLLRMSVEEITHPDDLPESHARRDALLGGQSQFFQMEKRSLRKDGHILWGLTNVSLVRGRSGEPTYYVGQLAL